MFSHVTVGSNDIPKAKAFYDGVGEALGLKRLADYPSAIAYGRSGGRPQLVATTTTAAVAAIRRISALLMRL